MESSKEWYKSKTIWAALVVVLVSTLEMFGIDKLSGEEEQLVELIMQAVLLVSGIVALVGRVKVKTRIGSSSQSQITPSILGVLILLAGVLMFAGCSKVRMSSEYAVQLEISALNVSELNKRCQAGDDVACKEGLNEAAKTLNLLVDALHGIDSTSQGGE